MNDLSAGLAHHPSLERLSLGTILREHDLNLDGFVDMMKENVILKDVQFQYRQQYQHCQESDIQYYCLLNAAGRRTMRSVNATKTEFVALLEKSSDDVGITYAIMREVPHLWA
eukprot:CAMPEP_0116575716 /NCGR_PEP_ID=MMETSP0397-20121206/20109_1 /TAXON_ID=216820 /ORGANISM="Cyclophora tenuis, Strain ECT3854" /LENGTH=112 /DNA_ID=CAMNT_0004104633 /DNA_START=313 /DNA_END=654 /DNA_ORIENTATION=+